MKIDPLALGFCQRKTLGAIFFERAISAERSGAIAFRMLDERGREARSLTVRALHEEANRLASLIRARASPGDRVLLLHPPGLDFIVAFLACLYADAVAVPANPPRRNQKLGRLVDIITDCQCSLILSTAEIRDICASGAGGLDRYLDIWLVPAAAMPQPLLTAPPDTDPERLALLHRQPKGRDGEQRQPDPQPRTHSARRRRDSG